MAEKGVVRFYGPSRVGRWWRIRGGYSPGIPRQKRVNENFILLTQSAAAATRTHGPCKNATGKYAIVFVSFSLVPLPYAAYNIIIPAWKKRKTNEARKKNKNQINDRQIPFFTAVCDSAGFPKRAFSYYTYMCTRLSRYFGATIISGRNEKRFEKREQTSHLGRGEYSFAETSNDLYGVLRFRGTRYKKLGPMRIEGDDYTRRKATGGFSPDPF